MNKQLIFIIASILVAKLVLAQTETQIEEIGQQAVVDAKTRVTQKSVTLDELPCLNKVVGQRLPHPDDSHKFLRCVSADTVWIETCPDSLFYNPELETCDWSVKTQSSTRGTEVVKNRPVLAKLKSRTFLSKSRSTTTAEMIVEDSTSN